MAQTLQLPMQDVRRTDAFLRDKVVVGLDAWIDGWIARWKGRKSCSRQLWKEAEQAQKLYLNEYQTLSDTELRKRLRQFQLNCRQAGNFWNERWEDALPAIVAAAKKSIRIEAYRTQFMGALALGRGALAEMATGEGKTLTIALTSVAAGWSGRPVHVITANDYLAQRDAERLRPLYEFCGLTVASINASMPALERKEAYQASIVYCTSKELVADYLRDQLALGKLIKPTIRMIARLKSPRTEAITVLRGIHTGFVDEADNQMIDEAVTPLIISKEEENEFMAQATQEAKKLADCLSEEIHYEVNRKDKTVRLTDNGKVFIAGLDKDLALFKDSNDWLHDLVVTALQAVYFFERDKQYILEDGKLVIVDEFTGRPMPGRSWRLGLHQAVEAKENLPLSMPAETLAQMSFQGFFRRFRHLSGITGTGAEAFLEFWKVYRLPLIIVPRHKPNQREDVDWIITDTEEEKLTRIVELIRELHSEEKPILVGSRSVIASENLANSLAELGIDCAILNAARHEQEARIVALAGQENRISIATNMAGRGTDITLNRTTRRKGGLNVILTEPHESGRVDRQLMGRAGRQGDPGKTYRFASIDDDLFTKQLPRVVNKWVKYVSSIKKILLKYAQRKAEKKARIRRNIMLQQDLELTKRLLQ